MNIYELVVGDNFIRKFIAAKDEEEALRIESDPQLHPDLCFRPFEIVKVEVEGYEISVKKVKK